MQKVFAGSRHAEELEFMYRVILEAGTLLLAGRAEGTEVSYKSDNSIVTQIDHQCAAYLDGEIAARFPGDSILNEETWHLNPDAAPWHEAERCWILDPLDSTSSYIRNGQHYGIIMALAIQGRPEAGMTYKPELGEVYFAVKGEGAYRAFVASEPDLVEVIPVKVSGETRPNLITSHGRLSAGLNDLLRQLGNPPSHRMNGSLKINEVARGAYTAFVSPAQNPMALWDMGATQLILEEAGGRLTDLQGKRLDFRSPNPILTRGIVASNGVTHQSILEKLKAG
ncbi:MAG TPA: inositol monophosphatase [Fibrobacteria bacterium]|nr:inositol monophosphatase [Fibrobacteria bacterium]